jgi:ribose transport system permease protein
MRKLAAKQVQQGGLSTRIRLFTADIGDFWIFGVLLFLIIIFTLINPVFFSLANWVNTSTFMTDTLILGLAETVVILTAGIDLSVGANMGWNPG